MRPHVPDKIRAPSPSRSRGSPEPVLLAYPESGRCIGATATKDAKRALDVTQPPPTKTADCPLTEPSPAPIINLAYSNLSVQRWGCRYGQVDDPGADGLTPHVRL